MANNTAHYVISTKMHVLSDDIFAYNIQVI